MGAFSMTTEAAEADIQFGSFNIDDYSTTAGESSDAILTVDSEVRMRQPVALMKSTLT